MNPIMNELHITNIHESQKIPEHIHHHHHQGELNHQGEDIHHIQKENHQEILNHLHHPLLGNLQGI